jgi:hypothetical protein
MCCLLRLVIGLMMGVDLADLHHSWTRVRPFFSGVMDLC